MRVSAKVNARKSLKGECLADGTKKGEEGRGVEFGNV